MVWHGECLCWNRLNKNSMKYHFILCGICALALVGTISAKAQTTMTLHDCMAYAVSNSTKIRIQRAELGDVRIARRDAILATFLPSLSAGTSASYSFGRNIDPETNTYINTVSFSNGYSASASMTLFNGFSAVNNLKISQTSLQMGETRERQAEADLCLAVMEAYYNVLYYKRLLDVCEEQLSVTETALYRARRQEELGQKGHADVVQIEAEVMDRKYELTNSRNQYDSQLTTLADLMFWPPEEELVIDAEDSAFAPVQDGSSTEAILSFALAHNPAIVLADGARLNAKRELNTARWQLLPSLSVSGGWSTSYYNYQGTQATPFLDLLRRNGGEYVSMSMSIPIFNRLSRRSNIARRRNALTRAEAEYDQKLRDVESEVRRAVRDRDGAETAYLQAQRKAEVQAEAYALNLKKLEQGLISPLEFQTASNNYLRAQADEMSSLLKYLIKQAVVRYYNGVEYIDQ